MGREPNRWVVETTAFESPWEIYSGPHQTIDGAVDSAMSAPYEPGWGLRIVRYEPEWDMPSDADQFLINAMIDLIQYSVGNRGSRTGNPYSKPEVRNALHALVEVGVIERWDDDLE